MHEDVKKILIQEHLFALRPIEFNSIFCQSSMKNYPGKSRIKNDLQIAIAIPLLVHDVRLAWASSSTTWCLFQFSFVAVYTI